MVKKIFRFFIGPVDIISPGLPQKPPAIFATIQFLYGARCVSYI